MGYVAYRRDFSGGAPKGHESRDDPAWAEYTAEEKQLTLDVARGFPEFAPCRRQPDGTWRLIANEGFPGRGSFAIGFSSDGDIDDASDE